MVNLICCTDPNGCIGDRNQLPWHCPEELKLFRELTLNKICLFGARTYQNLPPLPDRKIMVIKFPHQIEEILEPLYNNHKDVFICGGKKLFESALRIPNLVKTIHLSVMKTSYMGDCYLDRKVFNHWRIVEEKEYNDFYHYKLKYSENCWESSYFDTVYSLLKNPLKPSRNSLVKGNFIKHLEFDMNDGFPLLTTRRMFWRGIVEEFIFFVKGQTDTKILENKGIGIWKANTCRSFLDFLGFKNRKEGDMGPMYGYQWRNFGKPYDASGKGLDQLLAVIEGIKQDPYSRRHILTDYNPLQAKEGVLFPCHSLMIQFYVEDNSLSMSCYNRSSDVFLGLPFNISSSALLLHLIAKLCQLKPNKLYITLGDYHLYQNLEDFFEEQYRFNRIPYIPPTFDINLDLSKSVEEILDSLSFDNFKLTNYNYHPAIKAEMTA